MISYRQYFQGLRDAAKDPMMQAYYDAWLAVLPCEHLETWVHSVMEPREMVVTSKCIACHAVLKVDRVSMWY
jgi:hypothetical protein